MAAKLDPKKAAKVKDVDSLRKVLTFTGRDTLKGLYRDAIDKKNKMSTMAGTLGKTISQAVESTKLHAVAFGLAVRFGRMEEGKRAIALASFDHYREVLGLDNVKQDSLNFEAEEGEAPASEGSKRRKPFVAPVAGVQAEGEGEQPNPPVH